MELTDNYIKAHTDLVEEFVRRWFDEFDSEKEYYYPSDYYIISDDGKFHPGPLCLQDEYYFDISEIYECLKHNIPMKIMESWYEFCIDKAEKGEEKRINLINYYKKGNTM